MDYDLGAGSTLRPSSTVIHLLCPLLPPIIYYLRFIGKPNHLPLYPSSSSARCTPPLPSRSASLSLLSYLPPHFLSNVFRDVNLNAIPFLTRLIFSFPLFPFSHNQGKGNFRYEIRIDPRSIIGRSFSVRGTSATPLAKCNGVKILVLLK